MSTKELIISLIQQDLKHCQLVVGLDQLGLDASDKHCLELLDIVADLMHVPAGNLEHDWGRVYITYMSECTGVEIESTSRSLRPYAECCYDDLCEILRSENGRSVLPNPL